MNKRALLVVAALAVVALFSFLAREAPVVVAVPVTPRAALPAAALPSPPEPAPAIAEPDAGTPGAGVVTITLEQNGAPLPGPRVVLRDPQGDEVSGTTDVMGRVTFELAPGPWLVMGPAGLEGQRVEVTAQPREVTLSLPVLRRVEGTVLDEQGQPAADVPLMQLNSEALSEADEPRGVELARTDAAGHFVFETMEESIFFGASRGEARATALINAPASDVTLRLEEVAWLTVLAPSRVAMVTLYFGKGSVGRQVSGSVLLRVPLGELHARALSVHRGRLLRASQQLVVKRGVKNVLELEFSDAPPVSGVVVDSRGLPVAGVTVGLSLANTEPRSQERAVTDARGAFALVPRLIRGGDPLYEVHLLAPLKEKNTVRVRLGDAPVRVETSE